MPCAAKDCCLPPDLNTEPCLICSRPVHHICSNQCYEGELSKRCAVFQRLFSFHCAALFTDASEFTRGHPVLLGASVAGSGGPATRFKKARFVEEADDVLRKWFALDVDWAKVAEKQTGKKYEALRKLMCFRKGSSIRWDLYEVYQRVDILRWFREVGESAFPSVAMLARIWLGKTSSSAYQERVFSTGSIVMGSLRTRTDNERAEKQLLLRQNREMIHE